MPPHLVACLAAAVLAACSAQPARTPTLAELQATKLEHVAMPAPNLFTSAQPGDTQFDQLAALGVRRFVSLRPANEPGTGWEEAKARAIAVEFHRLPITGAPDVTAANAKLLAEQLAARDVPTLLYCANSNRVGALLALVAFHVDGKTADEALAAGKQAGLASLEPTVRERLR